jgi:hypothetical protein
VELNTYEQCERLLETAPIPFKPKRGNQLEEQIHKVITALGFNLPVVHIRASLYLLGTNRCNCDYKFNSVMVKIGGGSIKLEDYLQKNVFTM